VIITIINDSAGMMEMCTIAKSSFDYLGNNSAICEM